MVEPSRYSVNGKEFSILKNKLGITDPIVLEDTETILLSDTYNYFLQLNEKRKLTFNNELILAIHRYFLGPLYSWAGQVRTVEISKEGVLFCASSQINRELNNLNQIII